MKLIPEELVTFKVFGEPGGPHYAHYDLVGGRLVWLFQLLFCWKSYNLHAYTYFNQLENFQDMDFLNLVTLHSILQAADQLYPCIIDFLSHHDMV